MQFVLAILILCSWLFWLVALYLVQTFFRPANGWKPSRFTPPASILKPLKGMDEQAYENFASFCRQDYPDFELVFGVADISDPVVHIVKKLKRDFPQRQIRLYVFKPFGSNRKASLLHGLTSKAKHNLLVISDSDMRVTPDYLRRVVAPLADESVGLVTCPYQGDLASTFTARLEGLHMGATFLPSMLAGRGFLNMRFALGSTAALRRRDLARMGGFAAIANYLADDYQLGARIAGLGLRVHLSDYVVTSIIGATTFQEQWQREVRWMRCNRVSRPLEYPGLLLTYSTPLSMVLLMLSDYSTVAWQILAISMILRWAVAGLVTTYTHDWETRRWLIWLPIRDMLSALTWLAGFLGRRVAWRGEEFFLVENGRMRPAAPREIHFSFGAWRFTRRW